MIMTRFQPLYIPDHCASQACQRVELRILAEVLRFVRKIQVVDFFLVLDAT
jgi:hypothetical protein